MYDTLQNVVRWMYMIQSNEVAADEFWQRFDAHPPHEPDQAFCAWASTLIGQADNGSMSRRAVARALSPAWHRLTLTALGDMTIAADLARELASGAYESQSEADAMWNQMILLIKGRAA